MLSTNYFNHAYNNGVNNTYVMRYADMRELSDSITGGLAELASGIANFFKDDKNWMKQLTAYPITLPTDPKAMTFGGILITASLKASALDSSYYTGLKISQYKYPKCTKFTDFEPYTTCEICLPYYGFRKLNISEINDKYIQVRLFVDYCTGQAAYVIGTSETEIDQSTPAQNEDVKIIDTCYFQLGVMIPLNQTNFVETMQAMATSALAIGTAVATAGTAVGGMIATGAVTSTGKTIDTMTKRNPKTGRQITAQTASSEFEETQTTYTKYDPTEKIFNASLNLLNGINNKSAPMDRATNSYLSQLFGDSVWFIWRKKNIQTNTSEFTSLYGRPLGQTVKLSELAGYTEIEKVRVTGAGFNTATSVECEMIEDMLKSGIIL